jgi:hypothetical protein
VAYIEDVINVARLHSVNLHAYADDLQLYAKSRQRDVLNVCRSLTGCITDVGAWFASRRLQLNADKTEIN